MPGNELLYECIRAYKKSRALSFALQSGILSCTRNCPKSLDSLAQELSLNRRWLQPILNVLVNLSLVQEDNGLYAVTQQGLVAANDEALIWFSMYHMYCYDAWQSLPAAATLDQPGNYHKKAYTNPDFVRAYLQSMHAMSTKNIPFIEEHIGSIVVGDVLDVGAGPATFTRYQASLGRATVTALDFPEVVSVAEMLFGTPNNLSWQAGDFFSYSTSDLYDVVYCSHMLEYCPQDDLSAWLGRFEGLVKPQGYLVLVLFLKQAGAFNHSVLDLFELSTGLNGSSLGHICAKDEIYNCLQEVGYIDIRLSPMPDGPSYNEFLITCQKA